ncbi:MAG: zinc-ribbon domain-containing protein [Thermoplasmata archaeon]
MKTNDLVVGLVSMVLAFGFWGWALVIASGNCATSQEASTHYGIPLCSTSVTEIAVFGVIGLILLILAIIFLVEGRKKNASVTPVLPPVTPISPPIQICLNCGMQRTPGAQFCTTCGAPFPSFGRPTN